MLAFTVLHNMGACPGSQKMEEEIPEHFCELMKIGKEILLSIHEVDTVK